MKKLIMPLLLATTLTSTTASARHGGSWDDLAYSVFGGVAVTATAATFYPVPVLASVTSWYVYSFITEPRYYEGLAEDSIEVLAGNSSVEDSLSLSMFKEDLLNHQEAVEAKFAEHGLDVDLEQISDEELAELALATAQN
ncbi:MAG: hypothetical protein CME64_10325 [Halobacteriovoraceae bacterium]|nr:hypothetical protein [Halobacteriovoraceae bacterium]|tara:strand:+ start:7266 stop:7685 length:420 start_codon:yes stop_codon:yes gene_type:complete